MTLGHSSHVAYAKWLVLFLDDIRGTLQILLMQNRVLFLDVIRGTLQMLVMQNSLVLFLDDMGCTFQMLLMQNIGHAKWWILFGYPILAVDAFSGIFIFVQIPPISPVLYTLSTLNLHQLQFL